MRVLGVTWTRMLTVELTKKRCMKKSPAVMISVAPEFSVTVGYEPGVKVRLPLLTVMSVPTGGGNAGSAGSAGSTTDAFGVRVPVTVAVGATVMVPPLMMLPVTRALFARSTEATLVIAPDV